MILGLYAVGLYLSDAKVNPSGSIDTGGEKDAAALRFLLENADRLNGLSSLLGQLERYFQIERKVDSHGQTGSCKFAESDTSLFMRHKQKGVHFLLYINALKFLCEPLAELINKERKHILAGSEVDTAVAVLCLIQDALNKFCSVLLFHCRLVYRKE